MGKHSSHSNAIPMSDHFTLQWYVEQKEKGLSDIQIAVSLFIGRDTLQKWKKKVGWIPGSGHKYAGRKPEYDTEEIKRMRQQGYTLWQIANRYGVWEGTIRKYLKR
jgi:transposase